MPPRPHSHAENCDTDPRSGSLLPLPDAAEQASKKRGYTGMRSSQCLVCKESGPIRSCLGELATPVMRCLLFNKEVLLRIAQEGNCGGSVVGAVELGARGGSSDQILCRFSLEAS